MPGSAATSWAATIGESTTGPDEGLSTPCAMPRLAPMITREQHEGRPCHRSAMVELLLDAKIGCAVQASAAPRARRRRRGRRSGCRSAAPKGSAAPIASGGTLIFNRKLRQSLFDRPGVQHHDARRLARAARRVGRRRAAPVLGARARNEATRRVRSSSQEGGSGSRREARAAPRARLPQRAEFPGSSDLPPRAPRGMWLGLHLPRPAV